MIKPGIAISSICLKGFDICVIALILGDINAKIALQYRVLEYSITILYCNIVSQYYQEVKPKMHLKNLVKIRKQKGWSQEKLAVESGISYNTIIKIERGGIKNPKIETVVRFAKALGVKLDELVG